MIDKILRASHKNASQLDSLGTEGEESHEWLNVDEVNRLLAEDFQSGPNCFFELAFGESCREQGCIYFYSKDYHLRSLAILEIVSWEAKQVRQPDIGIGFALQLLIRGVRFEYGHKVVQVVI